MIEFEADTLAAQMSKAGWKTGALEADCSRGCARLTRKMPVLLWGSHPVAFFLVGTPAQTIVPAACGANFPELAKRRPMKP